MSYETRVEIVYGVLAFLLTLRAQTVAAIAYYNSSGALYVKPDSGSNSSKSWSDAQSYCKSLSSTLGVLDTPNQRQSFIEALNHFGYDTTDTWIGANAYYGGANNWRWLNGANYSGPAIQGASDFIHSFITISKPETSINVNTSSAIYSFNYLCQYPAASYACGSGRVLLTSNGLCYVVSTEVTTWFTARNNCLSNGGDLAIFQDLNLVSQYLTVTQYWIGLRSSSWNWQNAVTDTSTDVTYSFWANSQPNDNAADCMSIKSGAASDNLCEVPLNFICQRGVASLQAPTSSPHSSTLASYPSSLPTSSTSKTTTTLRSSTSTSTSRSSTSTSTSRSSTSTSTSTFRTHSSNSPRTPNVLSPVLSSVKTSSRDPSKTTATLPPTSSAIIIGIVVGIGVLAIAVIVIVIIAIVFRCRRNKRNAEQQNSRDQSVGLPRSPPTSPTYMQLQRADKVEENHYAELRKQNSRDQSVGLPRSPPTAPTYMQLQRADKAEENQYAELRKSPDYPQSIKLKNESGYMNASEMSQYSTHIDFQS